MKIFAVANQKGGEGKTTTAVNLATILRKKGAKVLLIDDDAQGNSTDSYGLLPKDIDGEYSLSDVMFENIPIREAIFHTEYGDIVPSDKILKEVDVRLAANPEGTYILKDAISELDGYDYVVIDTPPGIGYALYNALIAADEIIVTITPGRYGFQGLSELSETVRTIQKRHNQSLKVAGILMTMYDKRTPDSKEAYEDLCMVAETLGMYVFENVIFFRQIIKKAQRERMPLIEFAPKGNSSVKNYTAFVDELLNIGGDLNG